MTINRGDLIGGERWGDINRMGDGAIGLGPLDLGETDGYDRIGGAESGNTWRNEDESWPLVLVDSTARIASENRNREGRRMA